MENKERKTMKTLTMDHPKIYTGRVLDRDEILTKDEFIAVVKSYPSVDDAIKDGVGTTHSFPPEGEVFAHWNMMVWSNS